MPHSPVKLRHASFDDIPSIAHIHCAASHSAYSSFVPAELLARVTVENRLQIWQERMSAEHLLIIASVDDIDAGFAYLIDSPEFKAPKRAQPQLNHIFILEDYWNQGIGRRLCEEVCSHAATHGADSIYLWAFKANTLARDAYFKWGFVLDGGTRMYNYEGTEFLQLRFSKALR